MLLEVYNDLLSILLNTRQALTKMRSELEGKEGRKCWLCRQFSHLAKNCRNKREREEREKKTTNRFEALASRVMQCRVREVRRQETVEQKVKCFGYGREGHKKWGCPNMRKKERREEIAPQRGVLEKVKQNCGTKGLPPKGVRMSMEGWTTKWEVVTLVECRGCDYKGTKTQENQGQGFLDKEQVCNIWCGSCKEAWNWRDREVECSRAERVKCSMCGGKDTVKWEVKRNAKGKIFCPSCRCHELPFPLS